MDEFQIICPAYYSTFPTPAHGFKYKGTGALVPHMYFSAPDLRNEKPVFRPSLEWLRLEFQIYLTKAVVCTNGTYLLCVTKEPYRPPGEEASTFRALIRRKKTSTQMNLVFLYLYLFFYFKETCCFFSNLIFR